MRAWQFTNMTRIAIVNHSWCVKVAVKCGINNLLLIIVNVPNCWMIYLGISWNGFKVVLNNNSVTLTCLHFSMFQWELEKRVQFIANMPGLMCLWVPSCEYHLSVVSQFRIIGVAHKVVLCGGIERDECGEAGWIGAAFQSLSKHIFSWISPKFCRANCHWYHRATTYCSFIRFQYFHQYRDGILSNVVTVSSWLWT